MNDNAKLWVQALRSGKYRQGRGALNSKNGMCCLGVACEVYQSVVGDLNVEEIDPGGESDPNVRYDGEDFYLPEKVQTWLGLATKQGQHNNPDYSHHDGLAYFNDKGSTFDQIADIIESEPEGLFGEPVR